MNKRTCSIAGCGNPHYGRGLCKRDYQRARDAGTLENHKRTLAKPDDALDARLRNIGWTVTESGCWEFNGSKDGDGYGQMSINRGRPWKAYRVAYEAWVKVPEPNVDICHTCDNPPCINPAHLFEGSRKVNMLDAVSKGRNIHGERMPTHKLTDAQVAEIRERYAAGGVMQKELAREYGVTQSHVSYVARGLRRPRETRWTVHPAPAEPVLPA